MNRKNRTHILIKGSRRISKEFSREICQKHTVKVIEEPNSGLVMVKMQEAAKKALFYLGEVLVTECKVQIEGALGMGIITGHEPDMAFDLAVIDAACNAKLSEINAWDYVLWDEEEKIKLKDRLHQNEVLKTKVSFETMDV